MRFSSREDGSQTATVRRLEGVRAVGRSDNDDAGDPFLAILTNGKVTGDKIGPHVDLLAEFPYLGPPHNA